MCYFREGIKTTVSKLQQWSSCSSPHNQDWIATSVFDRTLILCLADKNKGTYSWKEYLPINNQYTRHIKYTGKSNSPMLWKITGLWWPSSPYISVAGCWVSPSLLLCRSITKLYTTPALWLWWASGSRGIPTQTQGIIPCHPARTSKTLSGKLHVQVPQSWKANNLCIFFSVVGEPCFSVCDLSTSA